MLAVSDLRVRYGDLVAVHDIDLDLATGETLALLGRSGSGKTTVLKAIAGLVEIDSGTITLDGADLTSIPPHRRNIGLVFQDFALFPHLDVGDNVAYGLRMRDRGDIAGRVAAILEVVGMPGMERRRIDQLSGGQAQRIALARTLATEPRLLLLDEPLGSLDPDLRSAVAAELKALLDRTGVPTIVVTHDTEEAFSFGDRVAVIVDGRIARTGTPHQVWEEPGTVEVARIVGHRGIVPATIRSSEARIGEAALRVEAADGQVNLLVRPDATVTPGPIEAEVIDVRYRGPDWVALAQVGEGTVEVALRSRVESGSVIGVTIDPSGVTVLS